MKTKYYLLALACLFACAIQMRAQYIWSNQLYAPEEGTTHVTDQPNIFSINAVTCVQDVDFDSVIDNLETSLEGHGIGWVSTDGYTYVSDDTYTIYFAISQNYGQPRSVCFGTESSYHEVIQDSYGPPIPVDFDKNWMVNVTFNDSGLSSATPFYDISYLDGLGYETHTIQLGASTSGASIVTPHSFDAFKRETDKWLPFPAETEGEAINNPHAEQWMWYGEHYSSDDENCTTYQDILECAPSGRKTDSYIPGYDMVENAAYYRYVTNSASDAVLHFTANQFTGELSCSGYYPSGVLRGEIFNDGDGRETITWTDGEGKVIRVDNIMSPAQRASTVYVYDSRGNQCWVISPEGSLRIGQECGAAISGGGTYTLLPSSETASEWCYVYKRDSRNRVTEKHIPGRGAEYYTYDALDRVISCSDPLLRSHGRHILYEYDALGRETSRFMENSSQTDRVTLIETWYDTSSGSVFPVADSVYVQGTAIANPKGLKTRERVAMIDGTVVSSSAVSYLERYYWYDSSGRVAQCYEEFPDGETLRTSYRYGIQGNVLKTMQTCTKDNASVWTVSTYRYDHRGRLASVSRSFSETSHLDDITYGYDVLGHPASRFCGGKISETQTYDIRGWNESLTASRGSNVLFGETLRYSSPESSQSEGQHNGNITEITSSHYGMAQETVSYFYDNLNRLHDAKHYTGSLSSPDNNYTERDITYDRNGNVLSMTRSQTSPQNITMTYDGNRLSSYCDSEQFTYDSNGNCCFDPTTGLEYSYNFLNLPCSVYDGEEMRLHYTYFADGTKYMVMDNDYDKYLYVGPFVYRVRDDGNPFLESVSSEEGRLVYDESSSTWRDCWFTKDHIGNVRTVLDLSKSASSPLSDIIVEQDSYLPFGTKSAAPALFGSDNRYRLCGKEDQRLDNFTTTLTDFGARSYNPTICRWMTIDPLAEKYHGMSPYNYCGNNPVVLVDPDGYEPTPKEAAAMAESAYQDVKEKRQPFLDKILSDGNWTVSYKQQDDEYGLKYVVYERANADGSKEYVCAFAGTDPFPLNKDPKQDVKQLAGKSEQYGKAVTKASELSQSLGESTELTFVGHSLGGGLAAASSMKTGKKAITFNSAALSAKTIDALNLGNDSSNIVNYVAFGPMPNGSFRPEILNHIQNVSLPGKTYNVLQFFPIHKMKRMTNTLSK